VAEHDGDVKFQTGSRNKADASVGHDATRQTQNVFLVSILVSLADGSPYICECQYTLLLSEKNTFSLQRTVTATHD